VVRTLDPVSNWAAAAKNAAHRHRAMRWLAPVAVLGAAAVAAGGVMAAKASPDPLPPTTPVELVAGLQDPAAAGFSGTVVAQLALGLPELPGLTSGGQSTSLTSLLAGSHTLRVWYGGPDKQRVALLGSTDETDVFHSGKDVWQWDSSTHTATHLTLPTEHSTPPMHSAPAASLTPQAVASQALAALDKSTQVTVDGTRTVADRSAYVLVLTPRDAATSVGSVRISVDGKTKFPLAVQVYPRGSRTAAVDIAFTDVSFRLPSAGNFRFTPPPGVTVHNDAPGTAEHHSTAGSTVGKPQVIGSGWSSIVEVHADAAQVQKLTKGMLRSLPKVSGAWGQGRLFSSTLVSALVTDDGRVFAGAVDPSALYAAASTHK
jgi:outer membrane lipoprotein-sorting protein